MTRTRLFPLIPAALFAMACAPQVPATHPAPAQPGAQPAPPPAAPPPVLPTASVGADDSLPGAAVLPTFDGDNAAAKAHALQVSDTWLALVDAGQYEQSWDAAASMLQHAVARAPYGQQVGAVRGPLGAVKSRTFASATYAQTLPGAPDGEYVVLQYTTVFEHKTQAIETVTPMLDSDGAWKVSGYYIR